jgi:hypothetical protein
LRGDKEPQHRSNIVYVEPYEDDGYDPQSIPERMDSAMQRTAEYVSGLNPNGEPHPPNNYPHHTHNLPPLTIRRHVPGSNDPSLQRYPDHLQSPENVSSSSKIHVTIKRNTITREPPPIIQPVIQQPIQPIIQQPIQPIIQQPIQPIIQPPMQPVIQPILYPVPIYMNPPAPQYPVSQPIEPTTPIIELPKPKSPVKHSPVPPYQPVEPIITRKEVPKPKSPVKHSPVPPITSNRYEPEPFRPPPVSRNRNTNTTPRRPLRLDEITPSPPTLEPRRVKPSQVVIEEYDAYDEYYRVPSVYSVPQKVVSYRTAVPGRTTREMENEHMDRSGKNNYVDSPQLQTITYRTT